MPRKKRIEDLKRREMVLRDETLHIYRAIARDKRTSAALRVIATDRIAAILGMLSPRILEMNMKQRPSVAEIMSQPLEGAQTEIDEEVKQILEWRRQRGGTDASPDTSPEV